MIELDKLVEMVELAEIDYLINYSKNAKIL